MTPEDELDPLPPRSGRSPNECRRAIRQMSRPLTRVLRVNPHAAELAAELGEAICEELYLVVELANDPEGIYPHVQHTLGFIHRLRDAIRDRDAAAMRAAAAGVRGYFKRGDVDVKAIVAHWSATGRR